VDFIFRCTLYYEIKGRFHCLFRESQTLTSFLRYPDHRCLSLYIQEALKFRAHTLQPPIRLDSTQRITSFFTLLPSGMGTKRPTDISTDPNPRSVRIREAMPRSIRSQHHNHIRSLPGKRTRSARPQHLVTSVRKQHSGQSAFPTSFSSGQQTLMSFLHSALDVRRDGFTP
jgi:hypothetical protein